MDEQKPNSPLDNERAGSISLAIFDGTYGKNAVLQKSYMKKGESEWTRSSINLFLNELESLKTVVDKIVQRNKALIEESKKRD